MQAEVISIGDELTSGQRLDTNSQWLSQQLGDLGIRVVRHATIADDLADNVAAFREASQRSDIIVSTGGLGPTADDLTRDALAEVSGQELELHEDVVEHLRAIFAAFGRDMPENNIVQARFPRGSTVIPNANGTAPGIEIAIPRNGRTPAYIFALPGVPAELRAMWRDTLVPRLRELLGVTNVIQHRQIRCFGQGESHIERMLPDLIRRGRQPSVGITASDAIITLRITAEGESLEACEAAIAPTVATIHECLGDLVFGEAEDELEHAVMRLLVERNKTVTVTEWGTGGLVSERLQAADVEPERFVGGTVVGRSNDLRVAHTVKPSIAPSEAALTEGILRHLAEDRLKTTSADFSLAVGPLPELKRSGHESPKVMFALATIDETIVRTAPFVGHPEMLKSRTAKQALNLLRLHLMRKT